MIDNREKQILKELKYGSKKAFEYIFKTYYNQLFRYAEEILKDREESEDVVESLFVRLWEDRKRIDIHTSIRSYLYRSTYNSCLNVIRKKKSRNKYRDFFIHHSDFSKTHDYGSSSYPLTGIIDKEFEEKIYKIIDNLPTRCKKIFLMSRIDNLSHKEIAEKLEISVNTVKSQIMNALKKIQSALKNMMIILSFLINTSYFY